MLLRVIASIYKNRLVVHIHTMNKLHNLPYPNQKVNRIAKAAFIGQYDHSFDSSPILDPTQKVKHIPKNAL